MASLIGTSPFWKMDPSTLTTGEIVGHMIEARHIIGLLQAELHFRSSGAESEMVVTAATGLSQAAKRIAEGSLSDLDTVRLEELQADEKSKPDEKNLTSYSAFAWLMSYLIGPECTRFFYLTFSKSRRSASALYERCRILFKILNGQCPIAPEYEPLLSRGNNIGTLTFLSRDNNVGTMPLVSRGDNIGTMLKLLVLWGGENIPSCFVNSLESESYIWGPGDEPLCIEAPQSIFQGKYAPKEYILELSKRKAVIVSVKTSANSPPEEFYTVPDEIQQQVRKVELPNSLKTFALIAIAYLFPKHRQLISFQSYTPSAEKLIPVFKKTLPYFDEEPVFDSLTMAQVIEVLEACFTASYFETGQHFVAYIDKPRSDSHMQHVAAIQCELGHPDKAIQSLEYRLHELQKSHNAPNGRDTVRLKISLGEAHIMAGLYESEVSPHFKSAIEIFENIKPVLESMGESLRDQERNIYRLRRTVGATIVSHMWGDNQEAVKGWRAVRTISHDCGWKVGHSDMIAVLSLSEVLYRSGNSSGGDTFIEEAAGIYAGAGNRYYFTGHGTLWPRTVLSRLRSWFHDRKDQERLNKLGDFFKNLGEPGDITEQGPRIATLRVPPPLRPAK